MSKVTNQQDEVAALIAIYTADVTDARYVSNFLFLPRP